MADNLKEQHKRADLELERVRKLHSEGLDLSQAFGKVYLERRISEWPSGWGEDFEILIYGDFEPPKTDLNIHPLGITIYAEKLENTLIKSANCVLRAKVKVEEKSLAALVNAARRINILLGIWTLQDLGNNSFRWWSSLTHGGGGSVSGVLKDEFLSRGINGVLQLPEPVRRKVDAALYWIREPRNLHIERHQSDILRVYTAYWNAFECLVEAVNLLRPQQKPSSSKKQQLINDFMAQRSGKLTSKDIQECYQSIVNTGLFGKASHALRECFDSDAKTYIDECFLLTDKRDRLYNIRNAINHGEVDAEHPEELIRIRSRFNRLHRIIWRMFARLLPIPMLIDEDLFFQPSMEKDAKPDASV